MQDDQDEMPPGTEFMPQVLIVSSYVTIGHVGLSAGQPVCQRLGVDVTAIPTIVLSNHPGWPHAAGTAIEAERILAMAGALEENGWLASHRAVLLGYMPSVAHVEAAVRLIEMVRGASDTARIVVDPILGDHPNGLYVPEEVAMAVRDSLIPLADTATPNLFELEWLSGRPCPNLEDARQAAGDLGVATVHMTSAQVGEGETGVLSVTEKETLMFRTPRYRDVPHGVGDVFAALIAANVPVGQALGYVHALARASLGRDHLDIVGSADDWTAAPAVTATKTD